MKKDVEYVLQSIAWLSDHGRTAVNLCCSSKERCDLLVQELRQRQFSVMNPVRTWYEEKVQHLLQLQNHGQVRLPALPNDAGAREEFLLRVLYQDPSAAEASYSACVGTFKLLVDISLHPAVTNGQYYFFCDERLAARGEQFRDALLLLRVWW